MASLRRSLLKRARNTELMTEVAKRVKTDVRTATKTIEELAALSEPNNGNGKVEPPEGSISIREASRKYEVPARTISRWAEDKYINVLLVTKNSKYIDEARLAAIISIYNSDKIPGRKTIKKTIAFLEYLEYQ